MEKTLVIDCGKHSTKYTFLSSKAKFSTDVECRYTDPETLSPNRVSGKDWVKSLSAVLNNRIEEGNELTILFLVETLLPRREKETLLISSFERFGARSVCIEYAPSAALFNSGETQGTVFDIGYTGLRITPVLNGTPLFDYSSSFNDIGTFYAEKELVSYLGHKIVQNERDWMGILTQIMSEIPETCSSTVSSHSQEVILPDGSSLSLSIPSYVLRRSEERLLFSATRNFLDEIWFSNLRTSKVLSSTQFLRIGGASQSKYFSSTLRSFLHGTYTYTQPIEIQTRNSRCAPVLGGCILSQLSSFKKMCISALEYTEEGPHGCSQLYGAEGVKG